MLDVRGLEEVPQLKGLSNEELKQLTKVVDRKDYPKGKVIFQQQQPADYFYLVKQGEVKLEKIAPQESQHISDTRGAGVYLGNFSLSAKPEYANTAQALTDCELLAFDRAGFNCLTEHNPACGLKIIKQITLCLCHLLREINERYIDMVDYMIDGELYGSRHRIPTPEKTSETSPTPAKQLTRVTAQELEEIPLFATLSPEERGMVAQIMAGCNYQMEEYIFDEHSSERGLYLVQDGIVKISKRVQQDKTVTLSILRRGKFFGVLSLLEEVGHTAAAQAIKDSHILLMDKPAFEELMRQEPGCGLRIMNHICQEVYGLLSKIEQDFNNTSRYVWEIGPFYL